MSSTNSESRKRSEDAFFELLDQADAKEREILSGVKPVNAVKYGFRECVHCGATWEEEVAPVDAIRQIYNLALMSSVTPEDNAALEIVQEWLDFIV